MSTDAKPTSSVRIPTIRSKLAWLVVACVVPASLMAALIVLSRPSLWWLAGGTALLLAGGLALAWRIGGRIAASVRALTDPALALALGQAVALPPLELKETDDVGRALTSASRILRDSQHRASHDPLTGLVNRSIFNEILARQLAACRRKPANFAIVHIDLDGFKPVNDAHGHAVGDYVLLTAAARLKAGLRESDLVARLGGDEFGVILIDTGPVGAATVAGKLAASLSFPYSFGSIEIGLSASVGVAVYPDSGATVEALALCAENALYDAKAAAKRPRVSGSSPP